MNRFRYSSNSSYNLYFLLSKPKPPFHAPNSFPQTAVSLDPSSPTNFSNSIHFHTKPDSSSKILLVSSIGSSLKLQYLHLYNGFIDKYRFYGTSSSVRHSRNVGSFEKIKPSANNKQVNSIIGMIMRGEMDLEPTLCSMNVILSVDSCARIFKVLNDKKVHAFSVCDWMNYSAPSRRSDVFSMVVDNIGRLEDYDAMYRILNEFKMKGVSITPLAFTFVSLSSNKENTVVEVLGVLKRVGGLCQVSGMRSLVEMLSSFGLFEMVEFVMQLTERKVSYYHIMITEKCRKGDFHGALNLLDLMRQKGCEPEVRTFNYVLSNLCRHDKSAEASAFFEQMPERMYAPDAITYEVFVCYSCKQGNFDLARKLLDRMIAEGIKPRRSTHAAIIKAYFNSKRREEAYQYVIDSGDKCKCPDFAYNVLARLYFKKDQVLVAHSLLTEMINKGFSPDFPLYKNVFRRLIEKGKSCLAEDLRTGFDSLRLESTTGTG